jgi:hypothetical protein
MKLNAMVAVKQRRALLQVGGGDSITTRAINYSSSIKQPLYSLPKRNQGMSGLKGLQVF